MNSPPRAHLASVLACALALTVAASACGKGSAPPDGDVAAKAGAAAGSASTASPAGAPLAFRWDWGTKSFVARGLPPRASAIDPIVEAAHAAGATRLVIGAPGDPAAKDGPVVALATALLELVDARLVVDGGVATLAGHAFSPRQKDAAEQRIASALGKVSGPDGKPLRVEGKLDVDADVLRPGEGRIELVGGDRKASDLKPREVLQGKDGEPDKVGDAVPVDDLGRIQAGVYELEDGTSVAVVAGRVTRIKAGAPAIVVDGRRFVLDDDIPFTGMTDPGGRGFEGLDTPDGMPSYGNRYLVVGNPVKPGELGELRQLVTQVVLHADLQDDAAAAFDNTLSHSLSHHFDIDFDGRVFQRLDLRAQAYHAGEANSGSVGIVLNNLMRNLDGQDGRKRDGQAPYDPKMARLSETTAHPRGEPREAVINGAKVRAWGYTEAQYRSLAAIVRRLADLFPGLLDGAPKTPDGAVAMAALDPRPERGVVAHWQLEPQRWDPGPAFDWARVDAALAVDALAVPAARPPLPPLPDLAPGQGAAAWKVELAWDRMKPDAGLVARGLWNDGAIARSAADTASTLGVRAELLEAGKPGLPEGELGELVAALLALDSGTLELSPDAAIFRGKAHNVALRDAITRRVEAARHGQPAIVGVTAQVEPREGYYPGEGGLALVSGDGPAPTSLVTLDGQREPLDDVGHIMAGAYRLPDDTVAIVHPGRTTVVDRTAEALTVGDARLRFAATGLRFVPLGAPADAGGLAFDAADVPPRPLADLLAHPPVVVLQADYAADARAGFEAIRKAKALSHFLVDFDGAIIQTADLARPLAQDLGESAIVITLNNLGPNLADDPKAEPYPRKHPRKAEMDRHPRPVGKKMEINGAKVKSYGYTDAQVDALAALLDRLADLNPALRAGPPRDSRGDVLSRVLDKADPAHPLRARWHQSARAAGPGSALDWDALVKRLSY